ncbi:MAG TPA: orotate phosphoribosyltransferase, partial [Sulfobacillus sp.]|nr:orotate phosphoribosyltransferase [Sulfobacillus sp.]
AEQGAWVSAVGTLVNRSSDGKVPWNIPFFSVLTMPGIETWLPENCPLCRHGVPLSRPKR